MHPDFKKHDGLTPHGKWTNGRVSTREGKRWRRTSGGIGEQGEEREGESPRENFLDKMFTVAARRGEDVAPGSRLI